MGINEMALLCLFSPLCGAVLARTVGVGYPIVARWAAVIAMTVSWLMACALFRDAALLGSPIDLYEYSWLDVGRYHFEFGIWLDALSLMMIVIVTSVSWLVHIYSFGYMAADDNQGPYFAYVSFFTFAMLLLVMANNLLQVFFGWEGVGIASYLLIGFWQTKEYPARASIKAFIVNRIGDMGLLVAIGFILMQLGDLNFGAILPKGSLLLEMSYGGHHWCDWICLGLLIGAMGKSAQMPLQVWLPDSMAGPTPISALIHAATMVTAGIYLICRFAPWFELSPWVQSWIVLIGFSTMLLMGLVAMVEYDIKRVIAYSTLSQLGMMVGLCGLSGYVFSAYHLATHAAFKALLFLAAGAVIVASNHEQDLRKLGGVRYYQTIHFSMFIGLASMVAIPPLSGFFSKDAMIAFIQASDNIGMYGVIVIGAVVTALYSTRLYYLLFWQTDQSMKLMPVSVSMRWPLWVLIVFSAALGYWMIPFLSVLAKSMLPINQATGVVLAELENTGGFIDHAVSSLPLTLVLFSASLLFYTYWKHPSRLDALSTRYHRLYQWVANQYGFNVLYEQYGVSLYQRLSLFCWQHIDQKWIDQTFVLGAAKRVLDVSRPFGALADGKLYHYVFIMLLMVLVLLLGLI